MTDREQLIQELQYAPDELVKDVLQFVRSYKEKLGSHADKTDQKTSDRPKPIWELAEELSADIPPEVLEKLPHDGAVNHDHYLLFP